MTVVHMYMIVKCTVLVVYMYMLYVESEYNQTNLP